MARHVRQIENLDVFAFNPELTVKLDLLMPLTRVAHGAYDWNDFEFATGAARLSDV